MFEWVSNPEIWVAFLTLSALEIVLGIDNIIFLSIVSGRLPKEQQPMARRIGLGLALIFPILMLAGLTWLIGLTQPLFTAFEHEVSWRDIILAGGGLFLLWKATEEIYNEMEGVEHHDAGAVVKAGFAAVVAQIVVIDLVFSIDSILTAIGLVRELGVMIAAVVVAIVVMLLAAGPISDFVNRHPSVKMLALAFLLMVGVALVADSVHFEIPRGYLYFGIAFSMFVEMLNLMRNKKRRKLTRHPEA